MTNQNLELEFNKCVENLNTIIQNFKSLNKLSDEDVAVVYRDNSLQLIRTFSPETQPEVDFIVCLASGPIDLFSEIELDDDDYK